MDDETRQAFATMMDRINGNHEMVLLQLRELRADIRNMRTEHGATREMVTALPATVLKAIEQPLLSRITAIEHRLDDMDKKGR